ncbi:hypothetical protein LCGC14_0894990 [marine sediment metagenome]|uniref:Uncharacterized protein n=1 Tax=marine sediment metagenome TaxID=412755 RepID=A0A0F9P2Y2_9ZZZZ
MAKSKAEREREASLDRQFEYWARTDKAHKAQVRPHVPLTAAELAWLNWYQNMTHNFDRGRET